jgi:hypothetical protein
MSGPDEFVDVETSFAQVADEMFAPGTVHGTLQLIVNLAARAVDGCDAAGILVIGDGGASTAAASAEVVMALDQLQIDAGEGPCLQASRQAATVYAEDLLDDPRWPAFGPRAAAAGIRSVIAFSLPADRRSARRSDLPGDQRGAKGWRPGVQPPAPRRLSALNLYARLPRAFGVTDRA